MYNLPYLSDIREKIDKKIDEDPDFYDNVRVNGLRKDIVDLLKDMRAWVDNKDQNQILGKNRTYLPVKDLNNNVNDFLQRHSDIVDTAKRLGIL
jgi:hypothetical protein|tara:strand:- start:2340 stop:2621 length:282 start_codon:yes stop_codon:yes gene_type:complete